MSPGLRKRGRRHGGRWQSLLRWGVCSTACLAIATAAWAQSDDATVTEAAGKGTFATSLAYLLVIVVVALGVVVVCRTNRQEEQPQTMSRDADDRLPGEY